MRRLPLLAALVLATAGCSASGPVASEAAAGVSFGNFRSPVDPHQQLRSALAAGAEDHHNVLVLFGSADCSRCRALSALAADPRVARLLADYHVVNVPIDGSGTGDGLAAEMFVDLRSSGLPAVVVSSPGGRVEATTDDAAGRLTAGQLAAFLGKWR